MLFISEEEYRRLTGMMEEVQTGDEAAARRLVEAWPAFAPSWTALAASTKDPQEALAALWKALWLEPCRAHNYLALGDFLTSRQEANAVAKHLRTLALWKLSFAEEIPKFIGEGFEKAFGKEAWDPQTYELMALAQETEFAKNPEIPAIADRLRPYRLFNQLQSEAADYLAPNVLTSILQHRDVCEPLLRNALHEWARVQEALDDDSLCLLLAILGEISAPEVIQELLELNTFPRFAPFAHSQWALYRQGQRHPQAALEQYRSAAVGAALATRGCLAEQISLMEPQPGDVELLASLLEGSESFPLDEELPIFLASVVSGVAKRGDRELAASLASRYGERIGKRDRKLLDAAIEGNYVPLLNKLEIAGHTFEGVCLERAILGPPDEGDELPEDELEEELDVEPPPKPGRNDPCWCGSGKKYKKCHMASDEDAARGKPYEAEDPATSLHTSIMHRVFEASREWHRDSDLRRAKKMYFGESGQIEANEIQVSGFIQWLLHDFRDAATRSTAIENFLRTRSAKLRPAERELLESLRDARFGLFEVTRVEPGSGVELRDIFGVESRFVHDISSSNAMNRWDCLLVRLQFLEGRWIMAGDGVRVPRKLLDPLREFVEEESRKEKQDPAEFVRANSHRLHRVVEDLARRNLDGIRVVNREGEEVSFGRAEYRVSDEPALQATLRLLEELEEGPQESGRLLFTWLQPMGDERRPLGHVEIEGGTLRLEAMSRTRLATLRGLVEFHAGNLVQHVGDHYTTVDEIKDRVRRREPEPGSEDQPPQSAEQRELLEEILHQHYAAWVDEPVPALGGKTPRQAVRSRAERESVIDLLRLLENGEQRKARRGEPAYDVNIIRRELGLPEE
jgi:hypothetical protein